MAKVHYVLFWGFWAVFVICWCTWWAGYETGILGE